MTVCFIVPHSKREHQRTPDLPVRIELLITDFIKSGSPQPTEITGNCIQVLHNIISTGETLAIQTTPTQPPGTASPPQTRHLIHTPIDQPPNLRQPYPCPTGKTPPAIEGLHPPRDRPVSQPDQEPHPVKPPRPHPLRLSAHTHVDQATCPSFPSRPNRASRRTRR